MLTCSVATSKKSTWKFVLRIRSEVIKKENIFSGDISLRHRTKRKPISSQVSMLLIVNPPQVFRLLQKPTKEGQRHEECSVEETRAGSRETVDNEE